MSRAILAVLAAALAGCASGPAPPASAAPAPATPASLVGTRWVGVMDASADQNALPRLEFVTDSRVTGYTGCNMMSGSWKVEGNEVRLGPIASTKRACVGPGDLIERRVTAAMTDARVTRVGRNLVFTGSTNERFVFAPAPAN